jgi:hypothetical protein
MRMTEKMFPIQGDDDREGGTQRIAGEIPWSLAQLAYEKYSEHYGTGQSLERLAERGGFGWAELASLLRGGDGRGRLILKRNGK